MVAPLRVCIDARLGPEGHSGGVQQVIVGLASGLAEIDEGREEYHFLVDWQSNEWLRPLLGGPCRALVSAGSRPPASSGWRHAVKSIVPRSVLELPFRAAAAVRDLLPPQVPESDGTVERAGIDVLHQTIQAGFRASTPSIYMPYDLQHIHFPGLLTTRDRRHKAVQYPALASAAVAVVAISRWGKEDLVRNLDLPGEKVRVIHLAPAVDTYPEPTPAEVAALRGRLALDEPFAFYPAQTWRHKNHLGLLEALALLRDRASLRVPTVFSGHQNEFFPTIARRARELGLDDQIRFLGYVSPVELKALYRLGRLMVFPSRFEGFGMPVVEAFRLGVPVACSNATSLPEVAGGAAVLFDPDRPDTIAEAIADLWTIESRRREMAERGHRRAGAFSWPETARRCRALYRLVGGRSLSDRERLMLDEML